MTKINSNPPKNFHYIFLMHRFMIFKGPVQNANFFVCVCCGGGGEVSVVFRLHSICFVFLLSPHTPGVMKIMSGFSSRYTVTPHPLVFILLLWQDTSSFLASMMRLEGWKGEKVRLLNGVSGKTFLLHLFPCTVQDLWSCLKAYFLYRFFWLDNRLWTSLSALQQIRVQKSHFFIGRLAYCQICLSVSRLCKAEAWTKWQESSCYFTNITFQLSARADTLEMCIAQPMGWGFVLVFDPS